MRGERCAERRGMLGARSAASRTPCSARCAEVSAWCTAGGAEYRVLGAGCSVQGARRRVLHVPFSPSFLPSGTLASPLGLPGTPLGAQRQAVPPVTRASPDGTVGLRAGSGTMPHRSHPRTGAVYPSQHPGLNPGVGSLLCRGERGRLGRGGLGKRALSERLRPEGSVSVSLSFWHEKFWQQLRSGQLQLLLGGHGVRVPWRGGITDRLPSSCVGAL